MSSFLRQPYGEQKEILKLGADLNSLEACSSCALFIRFPFGCQPVISTAESWLPRGCYKVFVKDHKSPVAKKSRPAAQQLNYLSNALYHQRTTFGALQTDRGQTPLRVERHSSCPSHAVGLVFPASCWFILSAPKAPGCYFQAHGLVLMGSAARPAPREGEQQVQCFSTFCYGSNGPHTLIIFFA